MALNQRLKELRNKKQISQKALSEKLGISERQYQRYESGEHEPNIKTLTVLADLYSVSVDYLIGRTDTPK